MRLFPAKLCVFLQIVDDWEQIAEVSPVKPPASKTAKAEETRKRKADEPAESEESSEEEDEEESDEEVCDEVLMAYVFMIHR